ncbi:hypothetical protein ACWGS5_25690 [Streptomyces albidoflavus]|uniref:Uncharacterized protein n=2 Tax=Streptomyces TaxID=1883 RepID=A0A7Y6C9E1_9ACTN|nr:MULTISPECIES: hypothetical protein [Streptomyces]NUV35628.1 hypothetical protein [Streptomyces sp. KAI-27]MBL0778073.1 hypothetical protein [Streptomyces albidoflavus]MBL0803835.1 hypothetical protein [Streptomyces albidoflavus]MBV1956560.1 hypothetical protein [Streptomyces sp. BV333]MCG5119420.1 hypothetical protein [Streptomyces sp. T7(2022)]
MTRTSTEHEATPPHVQEPAPGAGKHRGPAAGNDEGAAPKGRHRKPSASQEAEAA